MKDLFVYILTNDRCTTLYIGVTNNLESRVWQHQNGVGSKFAKLYNLTRLIYYETYPDPTSAIAREKQLKGWTRAKKAALIATMNPEWRDLSPELFGEESLVVRRGSSTSLHSAQNDRGEGRPNHTCGEGTADGDGGEGDAGNHCGETAGGDGSSEEALRKDRGKGSTDDGRSPRRGAA